MDNIWLSGVSDTAPEYSSEFLSGYPQAGSSPTEPGPWWFHMITMELYNAIAAGGVTPDGSAVNQLATIIATLVSGQSTLAASIAALNAVGMPYGALLPWPGATPPDGFIKANGALLSRTGTGSYPKLTAAVLAGKLKVVTEANWAANPGAYSSGDGSTTLRVPNGRGLMLKGYHDGSGTYTTDTSSALGRYEADGVLSHNHFLFNTDSLTTAALSAAQYAAWQKTVGNEEKYTITGSSTTPTVGMSSSTGNGENTVRNTSVLWCIRAYDPTT